MKRTGFALLVAALVMWAVLLVQAEGSVFALVPILDEVWYLAAPSEELRVERLVQRHERFGKTPEHARRHVLGSDQRNADLVAAHSGFADLLLRWPRW